MISHGSTRMIADQQKIISVPIGVNPRQNEIAEFLAAHVAEYFYCERCHSRMAKTQCIERQTKGILSPGGYGRFHYNIPPECEDCEQGRIVMENKTQCIEPGCDSTDIKARGMCKKHYNVWYARERKKSAGIPFKKKPPDAAPAIVKRIELGGASSLTLDFGEFPEIYTELEMRAKDEMRPVDMQVMFLLKKAIERSTGSR